MWLEKDPGPSLRSRAQSEFTQQLRSRSPGQDGSAVPPGQVCTPRVSQGRRPAMAWKGKAGCAELEEGLGEGCGEWEHNVAVSSKEQKGLAGNGPAQRPRPPPPARLGRSAHLLAARAVGGARSTGGRRGDCGRPLAARI